MATSKKRTIIIDVNAYIGGMGNLGVAESYKQPAINFKKQSQNSGVGESSVTLPTVESLDAELNFKALPAAIYSEIAKLDNAVITVKKAVKTGDTTASNEWTLRGGINLEYGDSKAGEFLDVKVSLKGLRTYTHEIDGKVVVDIDHDNYKLEIDGNDLLAEARNILN